jgi:hypothetical protein
MSADLLWLVRRLQVGAYLNACRIGLEDGREGRYQGEAFEAASFLRSAYDSAFAHGEYEFLQENSEQLEFATVRGVFVHRNPRSDA